MTGQEFVITWNAQLSHGQTRQDSFPWGILRTSYLENWVSKVKILTKNKKEFSGIKIPS
jgi:hypothetical protein